MKIESIIKKCETDKVEVEELLELIFTQDISVANKLELISKKNHWSFVNNVDDKHIVPLGAWAEVVIYFIKYKYEGLTKLLKVKEINYESFILSVLQSIKTKESIEFIINNYKKYLSFSDPENSIMKELFETFNLMLSFEKTLYISDEQKNIIRNFLHKSLVVYNDELNLALICFALRNVGNKESIELLNELPELKEPWHEAKGCAIRKIKNNLRKSIKL